MSDNNLFFSEKVDEKTTVYYNAEGYEALTNQSFKDILSSIFWGLIIVGGGIFGVWLVIRIFLFIVI